MQILVTGGAGYIGSMLVPCLLEAGHRVTVVDIFSRGDTALVTSCANPAFTPIAGDCRDERLLDEAVPQADVIIPLAALVGAPLCAKDAIGAVTLKSRRDPFHPETRRKRAAGRLSDDQFGYGIGEKDAFCTEESPLRPVSLYGRTKVEAERASSTSGPE